MRIQLNGNWKMKKIRDNEWLDAKVPGSVFGALREAGLAPDPYFRDNEDVIQQIFDEDYEYTRKFIADRNNLSSDEITLVLDGVDTIGDVYLNGALIGKTENVHRTYRFDARPFLVDGSNEIRVVLYSPRAYIKSMAPHSPMPSIFGNTGLEHLRKAQCSFGWDWGLSLPNMGLTRDVYIEFVNETKIENYYFTQLHNDSSVTLQYSIGLQRWTNQTMQLNIEIITPDGDKITAKHDNTTDMCEDKLTGSIVITDPKLWWPNGYGMQPLYSVMLTLSSGSRLIDSKEFRIGLRTITLRRENDEWGQCYEVVVNGKALFMRGSNLIIEDAVTDDCSDKRTERLLKDCVTSNFNCIRVWGGSLYPNDFFFDTCDRLGLVVFQDFMFSCHTYPATAAFIANVSAEISDNVTRIRNHACLGVWNGNNEIETIIELYLGSSPLVADISKGLQKMLGYDSVSSEKEKQLKDDYLLLFDKTIPELLRVLDPNTPYARSSPCIIDKPFAPLGENFGKGDCHYYINAAGMIPYKEQRQYFFRFVSEMGFQSYPNMKTVASFTLPEDRRPDSTVMSKHQKSSGGNRVIEYYMQQEFAIPKDFKLYIYASQITAGKIQQCAIEHMRQNRGRCMGVITWQLNDCWPVVSWSGIDYFGRWKAQQYFTKRFYEPILISTHENTQETEIYVTNDTMTAVTGILRWALRDNRSHIIARSEDEVTVNALCTAKCSTVNLPRLGDCFQPKECYLEYRLMDGGELLGSGITLFVPSKEFVFEDPHINCNVEDDGAVYTITLRAAAFAGGVCLDLETDDVVFSDNFFDLSAGDDKKVFVNKASVPELRIDDLRRQLKVISMYDIQAESQQNVE